jgi:hypothetical protein
MTAAAATTAAAEATAEVVETVIDNSGKTLAYVALVAGASFAVFYLVRNYGERAMDAAGAAGLLDPPQRFENVVPLFMDTGDGDDQGDGEPEDVTYREQADGQWAQ